MFVILHRVLCDKKSKRGGVRVFVIPGVFRSLKCIFSVRTDLHVRILRVFETRVSCGADFLCLNGVFFVWKKNVFYTRAADIFMLNHTHFFGTPSHACHMVFLLCLFMQIVILSFCVNCITRAVMQIMQAALALFIV